ncbi:MotA/TolQ/ExbB proton channel family protein, partial [bacterium]
MTLLSILAKGGYVMIAIALAAFVGLYVVIERLFYYRRI